VIDIEQWFTDREAIREAARDGSSAENGYYIRNANPRWRILEIDPSAEVALATYPFADPMNPRVVSLERFGELYDSYRGRFLELSPYWVTVRDGRVVAIEEQFLP
jgi:hypothetical protein